MRPLRTAEPARWRERDADRHSLAARAALLAEAASQVQPLAPEAMARILGEVLDRREARALGTVLGIPSRTRTAFAVAAVIICAGTASGAALLWRRHLAAQRTPVTSPAPAEANADRAPGPRSKGEPPVPHANAAAAVRTEEGRTEEAFAAMPGEAEPRTAPPRTRALARADARTTIGGSPPTAPPPFQALAPIRPLPAAPNTTSGTTIPTTPPPAASSEAALLTEALSALRGRDDPRAALAALDRHAHDFPRAGLATEAFRARIEALVRLGELGTTLALLDGKPDESEALGADLILTRAELRARVGRFRDALADFTAVLEAGSSPAAADERALYGRAVCLTRLGRFEDARAELRTYGLRFPNGRFAAEVRRLLAGEGSSPRP